jgi:hypothetical protein
MPSLFCECLLRPNSPYLNHFISADTVIPSYTNPQDLNRYSYVTNNPLRYTDPTGHRNCEDVGGSCVSENQMTEITRLNHIQKRHYKDHKVKDDDLTTTHPASSSGSSGLQALQQTLGSVNYNFGLKVPLLAGVVPYGDLQISWSPSLTLNNGSQVTVSPTGVTYSQPGAVSPRFSLTRDGPSMGYVDSPIYNSPALSGLSSSFPQNAQFNTSVTGTVRSESISFVSRRDITYTERPDYVASVAAPVATGSYLFLQAQKTSMGIPFCPNGVTC